jgi:hypothetical protein
LREIGCVSSSVAVWSWIVEVSTVEWFVALPAPPQSEHQWHLECAVGCVSSVQKRERRGDYLETLKHDGGSRVVVNR